MDPSDHLDLEALRPTRQLVPQHSGQDQARLLHPSRRGLPWEYDLEQAYLELKDHGRFPIQVLGTFSDLSKTFLWSWANLKATPRNGRASPSWLGD